MPALLVFGGTGFLGSRLISAGSARGFTTFATHLTTPPATDASIDTRWFCCDIADRTSIDSVVDEVRPDIIVNAAYVQSGPTAAVVCGEAAGWIAEASTRASARLVHVSTDLVFDGNLGRPYTEDDEPSPLSAYGEAKLRGEELVRAAAPAAVTARTSLIYGAQTGPQETLTRQALDSDQITFFTDEWRSPVHVDDLAEALLDLAAGNLAGLLHVAGGERIDRFSFAKLLAAQAGHDPELLLGKPQDPALGPRPKDVSLDVGRALDLGLHLPDVSHRLTD